MRKTLLAFALFLLTSSAFSQTILDKTNWEEIFSDDFNEASLGAPWIISNMDNVDSHCSSIKGGTYSGNVQISNGNLYLKGTTSPFPQYNYLGSKITLDLNTLCTNNQTDEGMLYGLYEIRCKMPKGTGWYAAAWLDGIHAWPPEIDLFEFSGNESDHSNLRFFSTDHWEFAPRDNSALQPYPISMTAGDHHVKLPTGMTWAVGANGQSMAIVDYVNNNGYQINNPTNGYKSNYMIGTLTSYDPNTGDAHINVTSVNASSPYIPPSGQWVAGCGDATNIFSGDCSCTTYHTMGSDRNLQDYFHTYSVLVTPKEIVYFLDGKEIRTDRETDRIPTDCYWHKMKWIISNVVAVGGCDAPYGISGADAQDFIIDYVKVFKPKNGYTFNAPYNPVPYQQYNKEKVDFNEHLIVPTSTNVSTNRKFDISPTNDNIYYIGTDHKLYYYSWTGSNWVQNGPYSATTDMYDYLMYSTYNGGTVLYQSAATPSNVCLRFQNSAFANAYAVIGNFLRELKVDANDNFYYVTTSNGIELYNPSGNVLQNIVTNGDVANFAVSNTGTEIYYRSRTTNNIYYTHKTGTTWTTPVAVTSTANSIGEILYDNCDDRIYYIATDNVIWSYMPEGPYNQPLSWDPGNNNVARDLTFNSDCGIIYYIGTDNRLWYYVSDKGWASGAGNTASRGVWYNHPLDWNATNAVGGIKQRLRDDVTYYVNAGGQLEEFYFTPNAELTNFNCNEGSNVISQYRMAPSAIQTVQAETPKFAISPNPASDGVDISADRELEDGSYKVTITDIMGRQVASNSINKQLRIDIANWAPGMYYVCIRKNDVVCYSQKIIKQ